MLETLGKALFILEMHSNNILTCFLMNNLKFDSQLKVMKTFSRLYTGVFFYFIPFCPVSDNLMKAGV